MNNVKTVIGKRVLVKKLNLLTQGNIHIPEATFQKNFTCIIKNLGSECNSSLRRDMMVVVHANSDFQAVKVPGGKGEVFIINESDIIMIKIAKVFYAFGNTTIIERINEEVKYANKIIIPAAFRSADQSMFGVVQHLGHKDGNVIEQPFSIGDIVHVAKWDKSLREIDIDKKYCMAVPNRLIDYMCDHDTMCMNYAK